MDAQISETEQATTSDQIIYTPNTDHAVAKAAIMAAAKDLEGRAKARTLAVSDADKLLTVLDQHPDCREARRYSREGFVANSYKYQADITCAIARRQANGTYAIGVRRVGAKRSYGDGSLTTINGKAA